jgi:sortase A
MDPNQDQPSAPVDQPYALPTHKEKVVQPLSNPHPTSTENPAVDLIREKLNRLYANEPDAKEEEAEVATEVIRSKHQQFMYDLSRSGKPLAQIQTEWHNYYVNLPENEKHEVWQEFYAAHAQVASPMQQQNVAPQQELSLPAPGKPSLQGVVVGSLQPEQTQPTESTSQPTEKPKEQQERAAKEEQTKTIADIRSQLLGKVQTRSKISRKQHFQSLLFGLATGLVVLVIMLFGFFNERFIAPFMTPSRTVTTDAIILDPSNTNVGPETKIIIPKINVEIPIVYDVPTIDEPAVEEGLQRGVVHYATTPLPGQLGNGVIFGHSANNILNKGQYKFAFVLLHKLTIGDTFYINYNGTQYAYKVFDRKIVPPTDISVLNTTSQPATFTLITCDPPGTSINRLIVVGQQISPSPNGDTASTVDQNAAVKPNTLPSNSPTLWGRFWKWVSN